MCVVCVFAYVGGAHTHVYMLCGDQRSLLVSSSIAFYTITTTFFFYHILLLHFAYLCLHLVIYQINI